MSNTLLIMGESGSGKSSSIRNLNPEETFIINVIDKPLPFKGFRKSYTAACAKNPKGNYIATDDHNKIKDIISAVNLRRPEIKNLIVDDFQYTMCNEFMRRVTERGYDKFSEIARNAWSIISTLSQCRNDLNCFVLSHTDIGDNGKSKCKTIGKMLDDKITVEGMFTTVLHTVIEDGKYKFLTQGDGSRIAKSPMGMFDEKFIDNDLAYVNKKLSDYFDEDITVDTDFVVNTNITIKDITVNGGIAA